jgi:transposase-like protein
MLAWWSCGRPENVRARFKRISVNVPTGVNLDGERDVLGLWLGPTDGEGRTVPIRRGNNK